MNSPQRPIGSLGVGFGLGWVAIVASLVFMFFGLVLVGQIGSSTPLAGAIFTLFMGMPLVAPIALCVYFAVQGRSRSALGVLLAIGSGFALMLLLVAACFGIIAVNGF